MLDNLNGEGVPDLFVSSGSPLVDQPAENPQTFGCQPDHEIGAKIIGLCAQQNFPQSKVELFLPGDDLGRDAEIGAVTDAGLLEGVLTTEYLPGVDTPESPWTQLFERVWVEHGGEGELTNYRIYGMSQAYAFGQALQAAGEDPTRGSIVAAVQDRGPSFEGPWVAPFRFGADRHAGISGVEVPQITGGTTTSLTPVLVTDDGDAPITEYAGAPSIPPSNGIPAG